MSNKDCFCPFDEDLAREIFKKKDKQTRQLKAKLEKIKEICKEAIRFCDDCHYVDSNYICIDCTEGGRADLAKEIMGVLKDEKTSIFI